jgi:hypothetical protein
MTPIMKSTLKKSLFAVAAMALGVSANAATVTYTAGLPIVTAPTEINQTMNLQMFDPSLGTLTSVIIRYTDTATGSLSVKNNAATSTTARVETTIDFVWSDTIGGVVMSSSYTLQNTGFLAYTAGQTRNFGPDTVGQTQIANPAFAAVTGLGTFGLTCETFNGASITGGGGQLAAVQSTVAGCGAEVTYEYTPTSTGVPEPATMIPVGLALVGLGVARRRKA